MTRLSATRRPSRRSFRSEVLRNTSRQVRLYFKAVGAAGRQLYSEIYSIPVVN